MISVIIPMYNVENYLHECILSVLNQSYQNFEIICVDDGSSDSSVDIVSQYIKSDERIKLFQNETNKGQGFSRNVGLSHAKGEYIFFLDADDWIDFNTFEILYNFANKNDLDVLIFKLINYYDESNNFILDNYYSMHYMDNHILKIFNVSDLNKHTIFALPDGPCNKFYSKSFLDKYNIRFPNERLIQEDTPFFLNCMIKAKKISIIDNYFYNRRRRDSSTMSLTNERLFDNLKVSRIILNFFLEDVNRYEYYKSEIFNYIFHILKAKYNLIDENLKTKFFIESKKLFEEYAFIRGLFLDMANNLKDEFLDFFEIEIDNPNCLPIIWDEENNVYELNKNFSNSNFIDKYNLILNSISIIEKLGLFDKEYYEKTYDGIFNPLLHYLFIGYKDGKNPYELFDGEFYTNFYGNVKSSMLNPLVYLALYGLNNNEIKINKDIYVPRGIDKHSITNKINSFNELGVTKEKRSPRIIITLTSFPERLYNLHFTLYSLLRQNFKPDEVILWLSNEEFPNNEEDIPDEILNLKDNGLSIKWCDDIKSYKKLIPALIEYPNDILVTADDDIFYPENWLKNLYEEYLKYPDNIICCRCHRAILNSDYSFAPFKEWINVDGGLEASYLTFSTSGSGALYPPNSLHSDVTNAKIFQKLCYWNDDMWFWAMAILNKTKIKLIENTMTAFDCVNPAKERSITNEKSLWTYNKHGAYDQDLRNIMNFYPNFLDIIIDDIEKREYKISIIIPIFNVEKYIHLAFESIFNQSIGFNNLEILFIDDCSTDNSAEIIKSLEIKYDNVKCYYLTKNSGFAGKPRNIGLKNASAEYIMFLDPDDVFYETACEILYNTIIEKDIDLVSGSYSILKDGNTTKFNFEDFNLEIGKIYDNLDENMDIFKLPPAIMTKIYRKSIISEYDITFPIGVPAQDLIFYSKYLFKSKGILFIDVPIFKYVIRDKGSNKSVSYIRNKLLISGYIESYLELYNIFNDYNSDYSWLSAKDMTYWVKQFILSDLSDEDKLEILKKSQILFKLFKDSDLEYIPKFEQIFEEMYNLNYEKVIQLSNTINI